MRIKSNPQVKPDYVKPKTPGIHEKFDDLRLREKNGVFTGVLLEKTDLSKIDEIGFVDLTPGSGHGLGGFSDVGWIEVYGKPIRR